MFLSFVSAIFLNLKVIVGCSSIHSNDTYLIAVPSPSTKFGKQCAWMEMEVLMNDSKLMIGASPQSKIRHICCKVIAIMVIKEMDASFKNGLATSMMEPQTIHDLTYIFI